MIYDWIGYSFVAIMVLECVNSLTISLSYNINNNGPKIYPCGTPHEITYHVICTLLYSIITPKEIFPNMCMYHNFFLPALIRVSRNNPGFLPYELAEQNCNRRFLGIFGIIRMSLMRENKSQKMLVFYSPNHQTPDKYLCVPFSYISIVALY
jgi:hypothetical protein